MRQIARIQASRASLLRADFIVLCLVVLLGIGVIQLIDTGSAAFVAKADIDTSLGSLPGYALLSFIRSFFALFLSYIFAIVYGTLAANNKTLEKYLIPLLDVLQSLPVIAFLPGFVLALISLFHNSRWGLEFSCILTIFTGQVWNLAFAYYESQKTLKPEFTEVAKIYRLTKIQKLFLVELPNGRQPLIYNGMMSMAGGWFFLTTCEAFTLGNRDFRLPGLGSFLSDSFDQAQYLNFSIGLVTLCLVIVGTDFLLWRPLIAWVSKFKESETENNSDNNSWFLDLIQATNIPTLISDGFRFLLKIMIPKKKLSTVDSPADYILQEFNRLGTVFHISDERLKKIQQSSWLPWFITFAVGGIVFSILPALPTLGHSLTSVSQEDWLQLIHSVLRTGMKVLAVLIISSLWAIPLGIYLGLNPKFERFCQPIIQNLAAFPAPVLFPLIAMLLCKLHLLSDLSSIILMCIGSQWYILFNVIGGASAIPSELKLVGRVYRFGLWDRFSKIYFPAILPSLATGWITAAGGAWNSSMVAEIVRFPGGSLMSQGIGAELSNASESGNYARLIAAIICIVVALVIINRTLWRTLHMYSERVKG